MGGKRTQILCRIGVCSAPIAVVPGRFAVTRMQTFTQVWWYLLGCLLRVECRRSGYGSRGWANRHSKPKPVGGNAVGLSHWTSAAAKLLIRFAPVGDAKFLRPQCRLSDARQTIGLFVGHCPTPAIHDRLRDRLNWVVLCRSFVIIKYSVGGRTISGGGHAAASFRDIPADPLRVEPRPMVWRSIAIAAQKFADSEPGLQIEDAHRGRPLLGRGDVWDRTGFAVSVLGTHSGNPARRSASARVERRSLFEE
jgi:hypothetical protein